MPLTLVIKMISFCEIFKNIFEYLKYLLFYKYILLLIPIIILILSLFRHLWCKEIDSLTPVYILDEAVSIHQIEANVCDMAVEVEPSDILGHYRKH